MTTNLPPPIILTMLILASLQVTMFDMVEADASAQGRAIPTLDVSTDKPDYNSAEYVEVTFYMQDLTPGTNYSIEWMAVAGYLGNGSIQQNGSINWTAQASQEQHIVRLANVFLLGEHKYTFAGSLSSGQTQLASDEARVAMMGNAIAPNATKFILFGDSLSDQGNTYNSIARVPDSPPYYNGRFSTGPIWAEFVASDMNLSLSHGTGSGSGSNRAWGGARTGSGYTSFVIPNTGTQIDQYLNNNGGSIGTTEFASIWIGGNDFLGGGENDPNVVASKIDDHVKRLAGAGATRVLVLDLPPLEKTPNEKGASASDKQAMHDRVIRFNQLLEQKMNATQQSHSVTITTVKIWPMFEDVYWNGSFYDIVNVVDTACQNGGGLCERGDTVVSNAEQYIFFDDLHPTGNVMRLISDYVLEQMGIADTDGDGVPDASDVCPQSLPNEVVDATGCDLASRDSDADGVNDRDDQCPDTPDGEAVDERGCSASQRDTDVDGVTDDIDLCPNTPSGAVSDVNGCGPSQRDTDVDGVTDDLDFCPNTPEGESVDENGCSESQVDGDEDGVMNDRDRCPLTPTAASVDVYGCAESQKDDDQDSIMNNVDICPWTPFGESVDASGCSPSQLDEDEDGVSDANDSCPLTPPRAEVDENGCGLSQKDSDGDGRRDDTDECRFVPGTIRGCPILELIILGPQKNSVIRRGEAVDFAISAECESGCEMDILAEALDLEGFVYMANESLNGTHSFSFLSDQNTPDQVIIAIHISAGTAWDHGSRTLTFIDPEVALVDDDGQDEVVDNKDGTTSKPADNPGASRADGNSGMLLSNEDLTMLGIAGFLIISILTVLIALTRQRSRSRRQPDAFDQLPQMGGWDALDQTPFGSSQVDALPSMDDIFAPQAAAGAPVSTPMIASAATPDASTPEIYAAPPVAQPERVVSYLHLEGGGEYTYEAAGMLYTDPFGTRWLQEADGSFVRQN